MKCMGTILPEMAESPNLDRIKNNLISKIKATKAKMLSESWDYILGHHMNGWPETVPLKNPNNWNDIQIATLEDFLDRITFNVRLSIPIRQIPKAKKAKQTIVTEDRLQDLKVQSMNAIMAVTDNNPPEDDMVEVIRLSLLNNVENQGSMRDGMKCKELINLEEDIDQEIRAAMEHYEINWKEMTPEDVVGWPSGVSVQDPSKLKGAEILYKILNEIFCHQFNAEEGYEINWKEMTPEDVVGWPSDVPVQDPFNLDVPQLESILENVNAISFGPDLDWKKKCFLYGPRNGADEIAKCEYFGRLFDDLSISERKEISSDQTLMLWVERSALFDSNWKRIAEIGEINLKRGLDLFSRSIQYDDNMSLESKKSRAKYLRETVLKAKYIDHAMLKIIIFSMMEASFQGDIDFFEALLSKDLFKMNQPLIREQGKVIEDWSEIDTTTWIVLEPHSKKQYDLAKSKNFFWIFRCMNIAHNKGHEEMAKLLFAKIKNDIQKEKELIDAAANSMAENGRWDNLMHMIPYAPESALNSFLSKYNKAEDFSKYLTFFVDDIKSKETVTDNQSEKKMKLYLKLLKHDQLYSTSDSLISTIKSGLSQDQLKHLESKKAESEKNFNLKCQICMDDDKKITDYFSCRQAKIYYHGACRACFKEIKKRSRKCPWCRKGGGVFSIFRFY